MEMTKLALYFAPGASSMAVHIALHEAGAVFEARPVSFAKKEQHEPWFRALNPLGQIPVLMIDGRPLTEVAGCLLYTARTFPDAKLLPGDAEGDAQVVSWMSFIAATVHPARRQGVEAARAVWAMAEKKLSGRAWIAVRYSIGDIHLFRLFWRAANSLGLSRDEFPTLFAHHDRVMERPAVKKTIEIESAIGYHLPA
jgi:glutathione S-transferase